MPPKSKLTTVKKPRALHTKMMNKYFLLSVLVMVIINLLLFYNTDERSSHSSDIVSIESSQIVTGDQILVSMPSIQQADTIQGMADRSSQSSTLTHGSLSTMLEGAEELNRTEQESLWIAFSEARRTIHPLTAHQKELPANAEAHFFAQNPGQEIIARFMDDGVQFGSGYTGREWAGKLSLAGSQPHEIRHEGTVLEYHYDGIIEWIENRPEGYRQGWVLSNRPTGSYDGHIHLRLSVVGLDVEPLALREPGSSDLQFVNQVGEPVLSYTGLLAWDANGQILDSSMQPTEEGLKILVADAGAIYPITIDPFVASLESKLGPDTTSDDAENYEFGLSVSISGNTALIGVPRDGDLGSNSGSAYVFVRNGTSWSQQQKLTADDGAANDRFGFSVSVSGDIALVGSPLNSAKGNESGSAYVFVRNGMSWTQEQKLAASDGTKDDEFGVSVSVCEETALVGAHHDDDNGLDSGSVYVFVRNGTSWTEQEKLTADDGTPVDLFGFSASLSGDTALVGAYGDSDNGSSSGSAYVFVRNGTEWSQEQKLIADDSGNNHFFGESVSLCGDTALIGAFLSDGVVTNTGGAYVFVRDGASWSQEQKLTASDGAEDDFFGESVSISGDVAVVGAYRDDDEGDASGSAYIFRRDGTVWNQEQKLTADDGAEDDAFGFAVSIHNDTVLIGARLDDGTDASGFVSEDQGSVYVFRVIEDFDQGSEAWQLANGFDPDVPNDEASLDSDGDGDLDMLEIFQGTDRNDSSERFGFQGTGHDGSDLSSTFRRSTTQTSINAQRQWSTDLINWYTTGQTDGNITVNLTETVVGSGTGFQLIEIKAKVTGGVTEKLFLNLSLSPNE
ncbi:MAG: FG-GAP repeat protein [Verrucomicrobiota bacterium]